MASMPPSAAPGATKKSHAPRSGYFHFARPINAGTRRISALSSGTSTMLASPRERAYVFFPLSNWTELDIWQYIHLENIPIVPLYLAAPRPTVERDGLLLMVDDDRFRLRSGEAPTMRMVRFRTLGCYPLTGAVESTASNVTADHSGNAVDNDLGAAGPRDRPRSSCVHGSEKTGWIFLMTAVEAQQQIDAFLKHSRHKSLLGSLPAVPSMTANPP